MWRKNTSALQGFHIARLAQDYYQFNDSLFAANGKVMIASFRDARLFAHEMNQKHDLATNPEQAVYAGQVNAMAMIYEISRFVFRSYLQQRHPQLLQAALAAAQEQFGREAVDKVLDKHVEKFPPLTVYRGELDREHYLAERTAGRSNREIVLEDMLMLWLSNANPAFTLFTELFNATPLADETIYPKIIDNLYQFFGTKEALDADGENIIDVLLASVRAAPNSLEGQLGFLLNRWRDLIADLNFMLLGALDLIKEESRPMFAGPAGDSDIPTVVPVYEGTPIAFEPERFSPDTEWMPRLVLIAKNAYVWLDQLSKKYKKPITRLDQIPDVELDILARWGFTGLWLIGLWERSTASQQIKQRMGNTDAVASAYSLFDYQIAAKLGSEAACQNLKERAEKRGIRLASDMVPNHTGVDGKWVIEHPDWFISVDSSPFPSYTFNGPDLSWESHVGIYIEDHYFDHSDASVVFKRVDRWTGREQFVYHGNDGTIMPWNDTAQLNYLNAEAREAVIQTILHVARQFSVIRFDAAMTLAKRHIQRLWFPEPGGGGAIASRAEHAMTKAQFDALMPEEFWREVVNRVAVEAPDTLLLAEAFWLMESYFVRTLGMHRVYNSAFMHMMRNEENAKYRLAIKNTLEFEPEILRRWVNFLNNPDEKTAVEQFGKGDKYFGVCTLMLTMPGLPMIGHGQIEGFTEKYGMEYQRAYWEEQPDQYLIERHERQIFPLMKRRYLFAGVDNFLLYDFYTADGSINEDVFAYSNRVGDERVLVVYHNIYADVRGWIRTSVAFSVKTGDERTLVQKSLGEGLGLQSDENLFCVFKDTIAGLEYIRNVREICEQGLYVALGAYQCHVFIDFRVVSDNAHRYRQLATTLGGRGVPNIQEALQEMIFEPVREPFKALVNPDLFRRLFDARLITTDQHLDTELLDEVEQKVKQLYRAIAAFTQSEADAEPEAVETPTAEAADDELAEPLEDNLEDDLENLPTPLEDEDKEYEDNEQIFALSRAVRDRLRVILQLPILDKRLPASTKSDSKTAVKAVQQELSDDRAFWIGLFGWLFVHDLGVIYGAEDSAQQSRSWIDEWLLGRIIGNTLRELGIDEPINAQTLGAIKLATGQPELFTAQPDEQAEQLLVALLHDYEAQQFLHINRFDNILWFDKDGFEQLMRWLLVLSAVSAQDANLLVSTKTAEALTLRYKNVEQLRQAASISGYQLEKLRTAVAPTPPPSKVETDTKPVRR